MSDTGLYLLIGGALGLVSLIPFYKASAKTLAEAGFLVFVIMVAIYVGAHLATSSFPRLMTEAVLANIVLGLAYLIKNKIPAAMGGLILLHGLYDFTFGHSAGVADWYPPLCTGFDLLVGTALIFMIHRRSAHA